ncbi:MAG: phosphoribosylformylglycinamidine cyclo-ligase [Alphaproteobacteria bacterium]|nr:phosphoribosylformylglycinamidine cyclo-ligase [Alphaproteobacteria bacterium]
MLSPSVSPKPHTYAESGVNLEKGEAFVQAIEAKAAQNLATLRDGAGHRGGAVGGVAPRIVPPLKTLLNFAAALDVPSLGYDHPVLLVGTDGVGTKILLAEQAIAAGLGDPHTIRHNIGIDLVAMCVNDLLCHGGQAHWFSDYFATGTLDRGVAEAVIDGIVEGCRQADCLLVGGETAEMPGMYDKNHYDLGGFAIGAVEKEHQLEPHRRLVAGDRVIGLASSGFHSNGFSLVRHVLASRSLQTDADFVLPALAPTRIYWPLLKETLAKQQGASPVIKGLAHITGGGIAGNLVRLFPEHLVADLCLSRSMIPSVFQSLQEWGNIADDEMLRAFNMGVGMIAIVPAGTDCTTLVPHGLAEQISVCDLGVVVARESPDRATITVNIGA